MLENMHHFSAQCMERAKIRGRPTSKLNVQVNVQTSWLELAEAKIALVY